jgi:hypothetical protein
MLIFLHFALLEHRFTGGSWGLGAGRPYFTQLKLVLTLILVKWIDNGLWKSGQK